MLAIAGSQEKWEVGLMRISGSVGHGIWEGKKRGGSEGQGEGERGENLEVGCDEDGDDRHCSGIDLAWVKP